MRDASPSTLDPLELYRRLRVPGAPGFLFESAEGASRVSYLGVRPRASRRFPLAGSADPFAFVERYLDRRVVESVAPSCSLPAFAGGLVGFFSFECVGRIEPRLAGETRDELGFPEAVLLDFDTVVAVDGARGRVLVVAEARAAEPAERPRALREATLRADAVARALESRRPSPRDVAAPLGPVVHRTERAAFLASVRAAKRHLARGEGQQIVLSQRFDRPGELDPIDVYAALREINPSPYLFALELGRACGGRALVGASPETLVRVGEPRGAARRTVVVKPIAGTRRRDADAMVDASLERELRADAKENAEHAMLVDLGRNDVGRVARYGSVVVPRLAEVERYSHVMHLVSEVRGELRADRTEVDALRAAFPAGTLSGSPKVRAIEILRGLEPCARGPYGGAVGFVDAAGALDLAITIRTLAVGPGRVSVQAGAGVVFDSSPAAELDETVHKARAVLRAAESAARGGSHV